MRFNSIVLGSIALGAFTALLALPALASPGEPGHHHDAAAIGQPADPAKATRTVEVVMRDTFYEPKTIQVKAGETVRFLVKNEGELLHEFNIGTAATHAAHREEMAAMVEQGMLTATGMNHHAGMPGMAGHGSGHAMAHDDPNSVLVEPGKSAELVWTFPQPTALEFACNVPGHYEAGMVGTIDFRR